MTNITIKNLECTDELHQEAMAGVKGGVFQYAVPLVLGWGASKLLDSLDGEYTGPGSKTFDEAVERDGWFKATYGDGWG